MLNTAQKLPSMEKFKMKSKQLKITENLENLGHAQNLLAKKYGFKDYNAIKPKLIETDPIFNKLSNQISTYKLSTGAIVNAQGLYKTKNGYATDATPSNSYTSKFQIEKALYFIDNVLEKRKTVNLLGSGSYGLKHYAEAYIKHYKLFNKDYYISNAAFIIALDIRGYSIKELDEGTYYNLNIKTNYKSFKGNFDDKLRNGEFDHTIKSNNNLSIFDCINDLENKNFKNANQISSKYFEIFNNRDTYTAYNDYFSIYIYHTIKAMHSQTENKFYFEINKAELKNRFNYLTYDNQLTLNMIKDDMVLTNQLLGVFPNTFYENKLDKFIVYWNKKDNLNIVLPKNDISKAYLEYDTFFHKFNNKDELEYHGEIESMDEYNLYIKYDYQDTIDKVSLNNLDNFIFYHSKKFRNNIHALINEASKKENHQFFSCNKQGYLLAKEFMMNYKEKGDFILNKICGNPV